MATLADAAVEIIAELDKFEPDLRRKLTAAVQSAADDAEREFRKAGTASGKAYSEAVSRTAQRTSPLESMKKSIVSLEAVAVKASDAQADAAGRVRIAEAALADLRKKATVSLKQQEAAISALASAQRDEARASNTARIATEALSKARADLVVESNRAGREAGDAFGTALRKAANRAASDGGKESGGFFARAFETAAGRAVGSGLLKIFAGGLASVVTAASPLGTILGGLVAGIVAVSGALVQAAGASISFAGVLGSIGLAAATVKIASSGLEDAFKAQSKALQELAADGKVSEKTQKDLAAAMENLAPSARDVVAAVFEQAGAWRTLRTSLQQNLFEGVGDSIRQLAATFLPILTRQLSTTAALINRAGRGFASFLTGAAQSQRITRILQGLNGILAALLPSLIPLADGFLTLFEASLPFALLLAQALSGLATRFAAFATAVTQSGDFAEFMRGAFEAAKLLLSILGNLGGILSSIFSAGAEDGVGLLTVLDNLLETFRNFLNSSQGQEALASFFSLIAAAGSALIGIFSTLSPLVAGIAAVFRALEGPIAALGAALQPVVAQLAVTLGGALETLAPQLAALVTGLTPLVGAIGSGLVAIFQALLTAVLPLVPAIVQVVTTLAAGLVPVIGQLVPVIITIVEAFGILLLALLPLVPAFLPLVTAAASVALSMAQILVSVAPLITQLAQFAAVTLTELAPAILFAAQVAIGLAQGLASILAALAPVIAGVADFVGQVLGFLNRMQAQGIAFVTALVRGIVGLFSSGLVGEALGLIRTFIAAGLAVLQGFPGPAIALMAQAASGIVSAIRGGLSGLAGAFRAPFDSAKAAVSSALSGILSTVEGFVSRISGAISRISSAISSIPRPSFPGINLPFLAKGGLTHGPSIAGEAGPEVVIPLNKPRRRDELLEKYFGGWADTKAWQGGAGYGGKTKEIHMPINVVGLSKDETVQVVHGFLEQRIGSSIGIDTSVGAI